ncbi:cytochrome b N-terminal domain-containing protein [Prosthecomicrobium sp. N25]|uniref:cytochrome b N-terminal domain-containing protein n=1 Tax=Prosthecomicrobium sp. N25 TaxID=3129254 RepID=UPI00307811A8
MEALRTPLRIGFEWAESALDRVFGPDLNPLAQLGTLGFFLFWVVAGTGMYLFAFFDTGIENAYGSVEWYTTVHWWHAGLARSVHRYASDLMVVVLALHLLREFSLDRYRGKRWFSWFTGVPLIWFLYASGITGYWLVWDRLAQYVAIATTELLDRLPIFGEPIARNFLTDGSLTSRFFTLLIFLHIAVPLIMLLVMWIHIQRISRPRVNPAMPLGSALGIALLVVSLADPAVSQGPADLMKVPSPVGLDWFYLPLYPLIDVSRGAVWVLLAAATVVLAALPWLPPLRRPVAVVDLAHCNGCNRCVEDCPYEALRLVPRTDDLPFARQVEVDASKCVSCGICMGACPSSTPFRRSEDLATGIDLPDLPLVTVRARVLEIAGRLRAAGDGPRILVIACEHGAAAGRVEPTLTLPCVAMAPPSLIDFALSRGLADGVLIAGCAERSCYNRSGVAWTRERIAQERDPYLRARVPRERIATVWASPSEHDRMRRAVEAFAAGLARLPDRDGPVAAETPAFSPEEAP